MQLKVYDCLTSNGGDLFQARTARNDIHYAQFQSKRLVQPLPHSNLQVISYGIMLPKAQASFSDLPLRVVVSARMVERQKSTHRVLHTLHPRLQSLQSDRPPP